LKQFLARIANHCRSLIIEGSAIGHAEIVIQTPKERYMHTNILTNMAPQLLAKIGRPRFGVTLLLSSLASVSMVLPSSAQTILQQQGTLEPIQDTYTFEGKAGDAVTIQLASEDFDTFLKLLGPDGVELETNDDYGGTLNSTIVTTLPSAGRYTVVASAFTGAGGDYNITVRPATEYEKVYDRALELMMSEDYADAIEAYTAAIALEPNKPDAYLGRADAYWGQAYLTLGENFTGPDSLSANSRAAIVADYEKAATLLEQDGQTDYAASLREQAQYVRTGIMPGGEGPM
jgi:tetratricopeptide (TPR) repeat protein